MIEHERSYVFTHEAARAFIDKHFDGVEATEGIEDSYLCKDMRVRKVIKAPVVKTYLTRKTGDKAKGYRFETEEEITCGLAKILTMNPELCIKKERKTLSSDMGGYTITMDFIEAPMRLAILEIEALSEVLYPIPSNITQKLFDVDLIECPLCAHSLFKRKIGICGGPSAGKSETAKALSFRLNTEFAANSFHVAEFATTFIQKYGKHPRFLDSFFVWHGQHEREHNAETANVVISDCPTFLSYVYMVHNPKETFSVDTALFLSKIYKRVLFDIGSYTDIIFMKIINYAENNIRYQSKKEALQIEGRIKQFLDEHNISYMATNYNELDSILHDLFFINV